MRKDTPGMCFESYAMPTNSLREDVDCKRDEKKNYAKKITG